MKKEAILDLIRQTAAENGGKPLGWRKFGRETGVRYLDWCGRYWARWGDAVREAGLTPNQLSAAYPDQDLFERYASFARELGRLPTPDELQLRAHRAPGFPSEKVFRRWVNKAALAMRLLAFCGGHEAYGDIARMCESYLAEGRPETGEPCEDGEENIQIGFVYLLKAERYYKIGRSNSTGRREYELAIQLPEKAKTVHVIRTDDPAGIERYWHNRFAEKRGNGEWFDLSAADVAAFKRRKFM
jgi:hypothetical protein